MPIDIHGAVLIDSVDGDVHLSDAILSGVTVVPRARGEYEVYMALPRIVGEAKNSLDIVQQVMDKLTTWGCCNGAEKAWEFYNEVFNELTSFGYGEAVAFSWNDITIVQPD